MLVASTSFVGLNCTTPAGVSPAPPFLLPKWLLCSSHQGRAQQKHSVRAVREPPPSDETYCGAAVK